MRFTIMFLSLVSLIAADPTDATIAVGVAEATKAQETYKAALAVATDKAIVALDKLKLETMKKGDLDGAILINNKIKELKEKGIQILLVTKEQTKPINAPRPTDIYAGNGNLNDQDFLTKMLGTWSYPGNQFLVINEDGTCGLFNTSDQAAANKQPTMQGIVVKNDTLYGIKWPSETLYVTPSPYGTTAVVGNTTSKSKILRVAKYQFKAENQVKPYYGNR